MEGIATFKYLGIPLDDYWPSVQRNIMRARLFWGRLGTLILREGADPRLAAMFYRDVVQDISLYGSEKWLLLSEM